MTSPSARSQCRSASAIMSATPTAPLDNRAPRISARRRYSLRDGPTRVARASIATTTSSGTSRMRRFGIGPPEDRKHTYSARPRYGRPRADARSRRGSVGGDGLHAGGMELPEPWVSGDSRRPTSQRRRERGRRGGASGRLPRVTLVQGTQARLGTPIHLTTAAMPVE